jgi:ribonuclease Z
MIGSTLRVGGLEVRAVSVGGLETCIELPQLRLCFDIGRCPPTAVRRPTVLLTHAHVDHAGGLATHAAMRDLLGMTPPTWVVPAPNAPDIEALLEVWRRLDRSGMPARIVPAGPGDRIPLEGGRFAIPFRVPHRVYGLGYAVVRPRTHLRPELAGLPPEAVRERRLAGEPVTVTEDVVEVAFCGDTTAEVLDHEPLLARAKVLILECTFLDSRVPPEKARAQGHVHLEDLRSRTERLRQPAILLTHVSARHSAAEILRILDDRLPGELRSRVTPLLPRSAPDAAEG